MAYDYPYPGVQPRKTNTFTGWDMNAGNPFGANKAPQTGASLNYMQTKPAATGMTSTDLMGGGTQNYMRAPAPTTGMSSTNFQNTDTATPMPGFGGQRTINTQTGNAYQGGNLMGNVNPAMSNQDVATPMPQFNAPVPMPGFQGPGFQTQYGTVGNIQDYMNPYLDQIIGRGNQNILATASARGRLDSSGTDEELGGWAADATAREYGNAFNRFTGDRDYMTGVYQDGRNFDYRNMRDTDAWNYGLYGDEKADWNTRMKDWYNQMNGISNTGIDAAGTAGDIQGDLGRALAILYGDQGNAQSMATLMGSQANRGFLSGLFGLLRGGE